MDVNLAADSRLGLLLRHERLNDPRFPTHPVSIQLLLQLLKRYQYLGRGHYTSVELLQQEKEASEPLLLRSLELLENDGLVDSLDCDAFCLTEDGVVIARRIKVLSELCRQRPYQLEQPVAFELKTPNPKLEPELISPSLVIIILASLAALILFLFL